MRTLLAFVFLALFGLPVAGADLVLDLDGAGRVTISDGETVLVIEGSAADLAYRLLGLEVGGAESAAALGTFGPVVVAPPPPDPDPEPEPEPEPPPPAEPWLSVRSVLGGARMSLEGAELSGGVFVALEDPSGAVTGVRFFLDGVLEQTEGNPPWDLAGGTADLPRSWDTTAVADGPHELRAELTVGGTIAEVVAAFRVANAPTGPPPPDPDPEPPPPPPPGPAGTTSSVERHGITWTFASPVTAGTFVNGDPWIVGPAVVASVSPGWDGSRGGSQVNLVGFGEKPDEGPGQGLDSILARYVDGLRARFPLTLRPGDSLVSTWSWRLGEPGCPPDSNSRPGSPRPTIKLASVLTCLAEPPPAGSFRPPYAGTLKPLFNIGTLIDLDSLPDWPKPSGASSVSSALGNTERLWLDQREKWHSRFFRPDGAMPDYGRNLAADLGDVMLLLLCNVSDADKGELAINLIQIGIDQWGVFETGLIFGRDGGGISVGHHAPIILAGYLLQAPDLRDYFIGKPVKITQERAQVARDDDGIYWRERDTASRANPGSTSYRTCCTTNGYIGHVLAVRALGLEASWAHADTFPYTDAYMDESHSMNFHYAWHSWHRELWESTDGGRRAP